jgi:hypothetical protein
MGRGGDEYHHPQPAVTVADGVAFCAEHAPRDSRYGLAKMLLAATNR